MMGCTHYRLRLFHQLTHETSNKGNHDLLLDQTIVDRFPERIIERPGRYRSDLRWGNLVYLQDDSYTATFPNGRSLTIYGCPWTSQFGNWAFQSPPIRDVFRGKVPEGTDILLTHGPPKLHLGEIWRVHRSLRLVVFGHIHEGYGSEVLPFDEFQETYEKILLGEGRFFALVLLGIWMLWTYVECLISVPRVERARNVRAVRMVNAAIASGQGIGHQDLHWSVKSDHLLSAPLASFS